LAAARGGVKAGGRRRSKTGLQMCSDAMRDWKLGRPTPQTWATLARCRALSKGRDPDATAVRKAAADELRAGLAARRATKAGRPMGAAERVKAVAAGAYSRARKDAGRPMRGTETREERIRRLMKRSDDRLNATAKAEGWTAKAEASWKRSAMLQRMREGLGAKEARARHQADVEGFKEELRSRPVGERARGMVGREASEPRRSVDAYGPGYIGRMPVSKIQADPSRFQYKGGLTDAKTGTTEALKDVRAWNEELAGVVSVWKDPKNGQAYVINGHHRLALAQRLEVDNLPVRFIKAGDAAEARAKGALQNIAEGRGSTLDAAKFFRDTDIDKAALERTGLSMREKQVDTALGAAKVTGPVWQEVYNERIRIEHAAAIGNADISPDQQVQTLRRIQKRAESGRVNDTVVAELIDEAKNAPRVTRTEASLFGDVQKDQDLADAVIDYRANVMDRLSKDKRVFGSAAKNAERLQAGGNTIDRQTSESIAKESGTNAAAFQAWKRHPEIKAVIDRTVLEAEGLKGAERKRIEDEGYEEIIRRLRRLLAS
jgi:hypothetical protein